MQSGVVVQLVLSGILQGGVYAVMASGLSLIFGVMRILQVSHAVLVILGCYLTYGLSSSLGLDPFVSIAVTFPLMFGLGVVLYRVVVAPLEQSPPITMLLAFFGVILIVENTIGIVWSTNYTAIASTYQGESLGMGPLSFALPRLMAFAIAVAVIAALFAFLRFTEAGRAIRAVSQDRDVARVLGVDVDRVFYIVFGIATGLAAVGGALMGVVYSFYPAVHWQWLGVVFSVVVLGGLGKVHGAVVAAVIIGTAESIAAYYFGTLWAPMVAFAVLVLTMLVRPQGLFGTTGERL